MKQALKQINTATFISSEILTALVALAWAVTFLNPFSHVFANSGSKSLYALKQITANENLWGTVFLMVGLVMLYGTFWRGIVWRRRAAQIAGILWAFCAIMFATGDPLSSPGALIYSIHAVFCAAIAATLKNQAKEKSS